MPEQTRVRATVRGRVQMVGFRAFVAHHAEGLNGSVANRPDGSVECLLEGPAEDVDRVVGLLHDGPTFARVENSLNTTHNPSKKKRKLIQKF